MQRDLEEAQAADAALTTEICVIGAGAAGISLGRRLLSAGHDVLLLESGGLDHEPASAALNAGECWGEEYYDLERARLRFFGGTTAIWGGRCAELDPIDFEARDHVPHSGWPVGWQDLQPYYGLARQQLQLRPDVPTTAEMISGGSPLPLFDPDVLRSPVWQFDSKFDRFTFGASADVVKHPKCQVLTHATVISLNADPSGRYVKTATVRSLTGNTLHVRARMFVLAAGGIENPRLLLASRDVMRCGLGNLHDQVGRYFMEHPHARGGRIAEAASWQLLKAFGRRHKVNGQIVAALIATSEKLQRRQGILNSSLTIVARQPENARLALGMRAYSGAKHKMAPNKAGRRLWMTTKKFAGWAQQHVDPLRPWLLHEMGKLEVALLVRAEQAPNPESRIRLVEQADALGMPRVALDWRLSPLDVRSVATLVDALGSELTRLGLGKVEPASWLADPEQRWKFDPLVSAHAIGGYHHMGTTRMSHSPQKGVTDATGRVHGIENLYVAGSSLFPTSGWANPTLTAIALGLRTADEIATRLDFPGAITTASGANRAPGPAPVSNGSPAIAARAAIFSERRSRTDPPRRPRLAPGQHHRLVQLAADFMIVGGVIASAVAPLVLFIECLEWLTSSEWPGLTVADGLSLFGIEHESPETASQRMIDVVMALPLTIALFLLGVSMFLAGINLGDWGVRRKQTRPDY